MTKEYFINGMSCGSCVAKVKEALKKVDGVDSVEVQLQSPQATIKMQNEVPVKDFQSALKYAGHYAIMDSEKVPEFDNKKESTGCCCQENQIKIPKGIPSTAMKHSLLKQLKMAAYKAEELKS